MEVARTLLVALGDAQAFRRRYKDALCWYERAIEEDPRDAQALARKGSALNNQGKHDAALEVLAVAEDLDSDYWFTPYVRACVLVEGDAAGSLMQLESALTLAPARHIPLIFDERDLAPLQRDPQFQALRKRFG